MDANVPIKPSAGLVTRQPQAAPTSGVGLCLSGGGYRAMLYHLGALKRLNELGQLPSLNRVSSVSGGSIIAGVLALAWTQLKLTENGGVSPVFDELVTKPVRELAGSTIDSHDALLGLASPGGVGAKVAQSYDNQLFHGATLQDLPTDDEGPRFVINATNLASGALLRFSRPYAADYRVGTIPNPTIRVADAVAASSAFPPFLSPKVIEIDAAAWGPAAEGNDLHTADYLKQLTLTDGGVYDNLGLEPVWKNCQTVLVSDGGGGFTSTSDIHHDWALGTLRVLHLLDHQVRALRKRALIASYIANERAGTYWGIRSNIDDFNLVGALPCPFDDTTTLANTPTRLKSMNDQEQERLINWGYAASDAGLRKWVVDPASAPAPAFPYPATGVG